MFWRKPKPLPKKDLRGYIYFEENLKFPAVASVATHTLAAFQIGDRTRYLLPSKSTSTGIVAAVLQYERRIERRELIQRLFYAPPNYGINLSAHFFLPTRTSTIFSFGLNITQPGYSDAAVVREVCGFIKGQAEYLKADQELFSGGFDVPEADMLRSSYAIVQMFWLTAIAAKVGSLWGVR